MFGPNKIFKDTININYCHRDPQFFKSFEELTINFLEKFNLHEYDLLFVPGSGTVGIEALMFSLKRKIKSIGRTGVFQQRWDKMANHYNQFKNSDKYYNIYCQLETSLSHVNKIDGEIVDAISAFPYYDIPKGCKFFITCSNKILSSYIGLSIVGVRKDCWEDLIDSSIQSYLNLARYKEMSYMCQTPSTAPTHIYSHLNDVIKNLNISDLRSDIITNSKTVVDSVGRDNIVGEDLCPVITLKENAIPFDVANKFNLYGLHTGKKKYQIFTYSQDASDYRKFASVLNRYRVELNKEFKKSA